MNGINLKGFEVRSFMIKGLTAKWGIGENRVPPIWDNNLIGYWDARDLPNGAASAIANKATLATKAPDLNVIGATMADGTLQFDGVNDVAYTAEFAFPEKFTIFWDVDWLDSEDKYAGISHGDSLRLYNFAATGALGCYIKNPTSGVLIPNTSAGLSTNGNIYAPNGSITPFGGTAGAESQTTTLRVGKAGANTFTQMGFRQLLIFNKELSPTEVAEVLKVMYPPIWDTNLVGYWDARGLPNGAVRTVANKATLATKAPDLNVIGATMANGTLQFDGMNDVAYTDAFPFPKKFTIFWDVDWLGNEDKLAGIAHGLDFRLYNNAPQSAVRFYLKSPDSSAQYPNSVVGVSTAKLVYDKTGSAQAYTADVGTENQTTMLRVGKAGADTFTQLGFRQLLIFNKELSQDEVNEVLTTMFPV